MKGFRWLVVPALGLALVQAGCSPRSGSRAEPLPLGATEALSRARGQQRVRPDGWRERAREAAELAAELAPGWVAPRRLLDDLERERLLGPAALARRLERLAQAPDDAAELYLVGRLEGQGGIPRLERAAALDPGLSWARHGVAWNRFLAGDAKGALREGRRALELARGSHELAAFAVAEARYLLALERAEDAVERLEETLRDPRLEQPERTECRVWLARAELESEEREPLERGFWRGVELLEDPEVSAEEREDLGEALLAALPLLTHPESRAVLEGALGADLPGGERLRARLFLERGAEKLAGALLARDGLAENVPGALALVLALERGDARAAIESWRSALPARVLDAGGMPRDAALRRVVETARSAQDPAGAVAFGRALLAAGWFAEARAFAPALALLDGPGALELDRGAAAGRSLLGGIRDVLERVDASEELVAAAGADARRISDLDELLRALQPYFERFHAVLGDGRAEDLERSPRLVYGGLASIVHPGPTFSERDARAELGAAGEPVPGLAREFARIGRFGIFGAALGGGGPDGALLRLLATEWRSGEHLGVPYAGLVAWCEGTDVPSRPARNGSPVSGAALHEGYWVDIEGLRREAARIRSLEREYVVAAQASALAAVLATRGPRLLPGSAAEERARWRTPLGEGERVLLALLEDRARGGRRVGLDELLDLTALHEEGHLTDRTRFLPLAKRWTKALGFVLRAGLTPRAIASELEYRAQLVALCEAEDPRLALSECLTAADEGGGILPHGDAYRDLVEDLLELVAAELEAFPELDPRHYLLYQLHFLDGEEVRRLARRLAERQGMVEE